MVIPLVCRDGHIPSFEGNQLARVGRLVERELSLDVWFVAKNYLVSPGRMCSSIAFKNTPDDNHS
jgi:hypothetical protein